MLEQNIMLDRRVILMARSLVRAGHEVKIVNAQAPEGWLERSEVELDLIPFPTSESLGSVYSGGGFFDQPDFVKEALNPRRVSRLRLLNKGQNIYDSSRNRPGGMTRLRRILAALRAPYFTFVRAGELKGKPVTRTALRWVFGTLSLPSRIRLLPGGPYDSIAPGGVPLDHWDKCVLGFAEQVWAPDIVCANDFPTLRVAVAIKKRLGSMVVYDAHELYAYQPGMDHERSKRIFKEELSLLKQVDRQIVLNEAQAQIMRRDSGWKGQYVCCPNATTRPADFDINQRYNLVRERLAIPENHRILLFQGGINKLRRTDYILRGLANARRKDVHMVFLTFGVEVDEFQEMANELGIGARVHFLPFQPWEEIVYWTASVDGGFLPYTVKDQNSAIGDPNKMYEFIMGGTPMIGPWNVPGIRKVLKNEGFGLAVPLFTVEDYSLAIDKFFDETTGAYQGYRQALLERSDKYHWDEQVRNVIEMYNDLSQRVKRPKPKKEFTTAAWQLVD